MCVLCMRVRKWVNMYFSGFFFNLIIALSRASIDAANIKGRLNFKKKKYIFVHYFTQTIFLGGFFSLCFVALLILSEEDCGLASSTTHKKLTKANDENQKNSPSYWFETSSSPIIITTHHKKPHRVQLLLLVRNAELKRQNTITTISKKTSL